MESRQKRPQLSHHRGLKPRDYKLADGICKGRSEGRMIARAVLVGGVGWDFAGALSHKTTGAGGSLSSDEQSHHT